MRFRRSKKRGIAPHLDLTPLLNCVLLLLLFFMLSSAFVVHSAVNIQMAPAHGVVGYAEKDLSITLQYGEGGPEGKGRIYVDDREVRDMDELSGILTQARAGQPGLVVLIRPDARIESARLLEVLGVANSAGIERYGIEVEPPETPGRK